MTDKPIEIPYSRLAHLLALAIETHQFVEQELGVRRTLPAGVQLERGGSPHPPEELDSSDEAKWQEEEETAEASMEAEDKDWGRGGGGGRRV
ncbi:hypothetical protein GP486_005712 [Trichoglossum hirsutum]|uniref:Uncharacterized protein n=1 Tax=Trichoglossum hirsutum TaxID=265104 RepID=A0A9P8L8N6_9PEZI|nr:hypothetical protein GP486_005712 [Trichoglossum hirsutum]